jgi:hypothetical protein
MVIHMNEARLTTIEQIEQFLTPAARLSSRRQTTMASGMGTSLASSHALTTLVARSANVVCC